MLKFGRDLTQEQQDMVKEFTNAVAVDERHALFDASAIQQKKMTELANKLEQPVTVELHGDGEIKTMADGTRYRVTPRGWKKLA